MFSEKIDYERIRRLILQNLEQLHSEVFKIKEEVSNLHAWNAVMFRMMYNQNFGNSEKTSKKKKRNQNLVVSKMLSRYLKSTMLLIKN